MLKPKGSKVSVLEKRVPKSSKYDDIEPVIDTGFNLRKFLALHAEHHLNARFHREEKFKRIKASELAGMIQEYGRLWDERQAAEAAETASLRIAASAPAPYAFVGGSPTTPGSSVPRDRLPVVPQIFTPGAPAAPTSPGSVFSMSSVAEALSPSELPDAASVVARRWAAEAECPYLLLDVRDREEYEAGHIRTAVSYPAPMLSRAVNSLIPELYTYKNKEGRLIVIYDADEKVAVPMGNLFYEKGFDNVYVLTKGLRHFAHKTEGLTVGKMPPPLPSPRGRKPSHPSGLRTPSSARSSGTAASDASMLSRTSSKAGMSTRSGTGSTAGLSRMSSAGSRAPPGLPRAPDAASHT